MNHDMIDCLPGSSNATDSSWLKVSTAWWSDREASLSNKLSDSENFSIASLYFLCTNKQDPRR